MNKIYAVFMYHFAALVVLVLSSIFCTSPNNVFRKEQSNEKFNQFAGGGPCDTTSGNLRFFSPKYRPTGMPSKIPFNNPIQFVYFSTFNG